MSNFPNKQNIFYLFLFIIPFVFAQCGGDVDSQLKTIAENVNKKCPQMLDQWTRLDSCATLPGKVYKYYHTVLGLVVTDTTLLKSAFTPQIISVIRTNKDMKFFRDNEVTLIYQYNDQEKKYLFTIPITPEKYKK